MRQTPASFNSRIKRTPFGQPRKEREKNEERFQARVVELAQYLGWWPFHMYHAARSPAGWPDLVLFRERIVFVELKARDAKGRMGTLKPVQTDMAHRCFKAGAEYYAWYDTNEDWEQIKAVLSEGGSVVAT